MVRKLLNGGHLVFSTMSVLVVVTIKYAPVMSETSNVFCNYANFTWPVKRKSFLGGVAAIFKCQIRRAHQESALALS